MSHSMGPAEAVFLESKAKQVQKRLQREMRSLKRQGFVALASDMASKPAPGVMRQMSGIKRRLQNLSRMPGPGLSTDKLGAYAGIL